VSSAVRSTISVQPCPPLLVPLTQKCAKLVDHELLREKGATETHRIRMGLGYLLDETVTYVTYSTAVHVLEETLSLNVTMVNNVGDVCEGL
jgi:hypothetical protein